MNRQETKLLNDMIAGCLDKSEIPCFFISDGSIISWELSRNCLWMEAPEACEPEQLGASDDNANRIEQLLESVDRGIQELLDQLGELESGDEIDTPSGRDEGDEEKS